MDTSIMEPACAGIYIYILKQYIEFVILINMHRIRWEILK